MPMHWSGLEGMPRRVYTFPTGLGLEWYNLLSTMGALVLVAGVVVSLAAFALSFRRGRLAGRDPWGGDSLEWAETSPPADAQFARIPLVRSRHPLWEQATILPAPADDPEVVRAVDALDHRPERWRGNIVVGVLDGRPIGIAHLPRRSIWPFVLSVGFLLLFVSALLDNGLLAMAGAAVSAAGIAGWFWPIDTESVAIAEAGADRPGEPPPAGAPPLPLLVGRRSANGYWASIVIVVILATALATFLAGYFYLGQGPDAVPPGEAPPPLAPALWATLPLLVALAATRWMTALVDRGADRIRWIPIALAMLAHLAFAWLSIGAFGSSGLRPSESGWASGVLGVIGFGWFVAGGTVLMFFVALLWAVRAPRDPRGRGVALNTSPISYFAVAEWMLTLLAVHLWPRIA
jgi:cytochrome c oxidase subunit I+III